MPLVRLSAFFGAVVVAGNVLLHAAYTPPQTFQDADAQGDYLGKRMRQIEKRIRTVERFFFGTGMKPSLAPSNGSGAMWMADPVLELVQDAGSISETGSGLVGMPVRMAASDPLAVPLAAERSEILAFAWPAAWGPESRSLFERSLLEPLVTPEFVAGFYRFGAPPDLWGIGDALLRGPEAVLDSMLRCATDLFPRSGEYCLPYDCDCITDRLLDYDLGPRQGRIFTQFLGFLVEREQRYFSRFSDSGLETPGVEDGTEDVDLNDILRDQGKVVWDALRKTYFSKYKFHGEDRVKEEAFYFNQWRGVDFVIIPPLIAGYVYYRGLDKRFSLGETWLRFTVEPVSRWVSGKENLYAGVSVEWGIKGFPVGLIVSAGRYDGKAGIDFVGIGTSVGMVRTALAVQRGD